jgi:hypothetical protein
MAATPKKFIKAKDVRVKVHLPKVKRSGKKEIELIITLPEDAVRNLARRLEKRFRKEKRK